MKTAVRTRYSTTRRPFPLRKNLRTPRYPANDGRRRESSDEARGRVKGEVKQGEREQRRAMIPIATMISDNQSLLLLLLLQRTPPSIDPSYSTGTLLYCTSTRLLD
jgi:hypothetical protein